MSSQKNEIPADLLTFIHRCIDSVEGLQVLVLLLEQRAEPWTIDRISEELRSSRASVLKRVKDLQASQVLAPGALTSDESLRFFATSSEVERMVRELSDLYRLRPHRVIAQIFARPPASLLSFADAFKIKKENT